MTGTRVLLLCLGLLAGCGEDMSRYFDDHGWGYSYDFAFADGTRFRNNPPVTAFTQVEAEHMIDEVYHEVEACAGIVAPGPLVIAVPNDVLGGNGGMTYPHDALIVVTDNSAQDGWDQVATWNGTAFVNGPLSVLRHEMVHHLLGASGFPDDDNHWHRSPLFIQCSGVAGVTG